MGKSVDQKIINVALSALSRPGEITLLDQLYADNHDIREVFEALKAMLTDNHDLMLTGKIATPGPSNPATLRCAADERDNSQSLETVSLKPSQGSDISYSPKWVRIRRMTMIQHGKKAVVDVTLHPKDGSAHLSPVAA